MKKFISIIVIIIQFIWSLIVDFFEALIDTFSKPTGFNAKFGKMSLISSRFNKGFVVGSGYRKITRKAAHSNMVIIGVTGMGKSTRYSIPTILTLGHASLLIHDPSRELFQATSGYLSQSMTVKTLNFSDHTVSAGYNLLSRIKTPNDVNKFAHLLVSTSLDKGGDPFWSLSAKSLLSILTRLVLHQPAEYANITNIIHVLSVFAAEPQRVDVWISKTGNDKLIADYKATISNSPKTLQSIVSSLRAALECYDSPEIAKVCSCDTIDFDSLRTQPQAIFLHNSTSDLSFLSSLTSVFFEQFYSHILQKLPTKKDLDVFCILDEMSSLRVPLMPLALSNCRKFRNGNLLFIQNKAQLRNFYREDADSIISNCLTKIYLPGASAIDELRDIEALSGKYTYLEKGREKTKNLVTVDEIRQLPINRSLILSQNHPIIKGRSTPYYRSLTCRRYASIPPIPLRGDIPDAPIPLLK